VRYRSRIFLPGSGPGDCRNSEKGPPTNTNTIAELGIFRLDRALYSPVDYPGDYGFIPGTRSADGDPLDVLALAEEPSFSGCMVEVRPIGILNMIDQQKTDRKVLGVPNGNPRYDQVQDMDQIFTLVRREIEHSFTIYKELEGRATTTLGWKEVDQARKVILDCRNTYLKGKADR
jgi:inorganic pyrophosphatase